jgi:CRP/FNR family transcriptional regulator, cyclic AMP receptor protein
MLALTDVRAVRIDPDTMLHMVHEDVDVCDAFLSFLIDLRVRAQQNLANNLLYSSEERLARALSSIAQSHQDAQPWPKVTQQELANMIGVTRQRVTVLLKRFRESGGHSVR